MTKEEAYKLLSEAKKNLVDFVQSRAYGPDTLKDLEKKVIKDKKVWMKLVTAELKAEHKRLEK